MGYQGALITGGSQRLGRAMALSLAARGVSVAVHYSSSADAAEETVADIINAGGHAVAVHADLLDHEQTETLVQRSIDALGVPISILVNNASIFEYDTIETATRKSWDRHIDSNLWGPFALIQEMAKQTPSAIENSRGELDAQACVINMVDQRVRKLTPEFMTYTLAKACLWTLTQTAAQALAPHIRVNAIGPGPTLRGARQSTQHFEAQRRNTILKRGSDVDGIVSAMNYLLDAKGVTGQLICVDGGQHMAWQTPDIIGVE
ncbi:short chain dehydrogenase [Amylibacter ulvae]|uniref:Short chain dehydrogenase n=1 Tax=Paramylibacter ulvae TaxID=1651968 RepID=A0ABQ3D4B9_9RHOB|nr:SDR family oxidoreductase [Amylibacter ulvae]GHA58087.1 short chain dehydrogenase [Amylibacter ulvae]